MTADEARYYLRSLPMYAASCRAFAKTAKTVEGARIYRRNAEEAERRIEQCRAVLTADHNLNKLEQ